MVPTVLNVKFSQLIQLGKNFAYLGGFSFITNKITRSFKMVLLGEINNSNRYILKIY